MQLGINNLSRSYPSDVLTYVGHRTDRMYDLIGLNGTGKSTPIQIITALQEADTSVQLLQVTLTC